MEKQPKNVQAVLDWVKENRPDCLLTYEEIFKHIMPSDPPHPPREGIVGFILMGFEAGRVFQKQNPNVESGIGYIS